MSECNVKGIKYTLSVGLSKDLLSHFSKAEMELKRKQEEEDRKKRAKEEKVMQVWTINKCSYICPSAVVLFCDKVVKPGRRI